MKSFSTCSARSASARLSDGCSRVSVFSRNAWSTASEIACFSASSVGAAAVGAAAAGAAEHTLATEMTQCTHKTAQSAPKARLIARHGARSHLARTSTRALRPPAGAAESFHVDVKVLGFEVRDRALPDLEPDGDCVHLRARDGESPRLRVTDEVHHVELDLRAVAALVPDPVDDGPIVYGAIPNIPDAWDVGDSDALIRRIWRAGGLLARRVTQPDHEVHAEAGVRAEPNVVRGVVRPRVVVRRPAPAG